MYADANRGFVVPAGYLGLVDDFHQPGGSHWSGILADGRFVPDNSAPSSMTEWNERESVFRCPSGRDEPDGAVIPLLAPPSPWSALGARMTERYDELNGTFCRTWYAVNCTPGTPLGFQPFRMLPGVSAGDYRLPKLAQCSDASRLVMVFDGLFMLAWYDPSFINARHKNRTLTNLLMADGHAASVPTRRVVSSWYNYQGQDDIRWTLGQQPLFLRRGPATVTHGPSRISSTLRNSTGWLSAWSAM